MRGDYAAITRRLRNNYEAIAGRSRGDYKAITKRLRDDCEAITRRFRGDYEAITKRLRDDCKAIAMRIRGNYEAKCAHNAVATNPRVRVRVRVRVRLVLITQSLRTLREVADGEPGFEPSDPLSAAKRFMECSSCRMVAT